MLSTLALRRRTRFDSKSAAVKSWASKPPFSSFDRRSLELYAEHGLRQLPGARDYPFMLQRHFRIGPRNVGRWLALPSWPTDAHEFPAEGAGC